MSLFSIIFSTPLIAEIFISCIVIFQIGAIIADDEEPIENEFGEVITAPLITLKWQNNEYNCVNEGNQTYQLFNGPKKCPKSCQETLEKLLLNSKNDSTLLELVIPGNLTKTSSIVTAVLNGTVYWGNQRTWSVPQYQLQFCFNLSQGTPLSCPQGVFVSNMHHINDSEEFIHSPCNVQDVPALLPLFNQRRYGYFAYTTADAKKLIVYNGCWNPNTRETGPEHIIFGGRKTWDLPNISSSSDGEGCGSVDVSFDFFRRHNDGSASFWDYFSHQHFLRWFEMVQLDCPMSWENGQASVQNLTIETLGSKGCNLIVSINGIHLRKIVNTTLTD
ncbi:hypothetical protein DdX_17447 [Ditylenchus destructor]|uniref:Uncharacterized protein n=1 Tax=Ditylenchus destructor TaxID=166010 RepID=A0AAD4MLP3_9BILA|nr:hypothetical protein DdX_17447 [Ditylenchus destructor]